MLEVVAMIFIGQLGTSEEIAGAGLAFTITNIFVFSFGFGLNGAIETLATQAFGAGDLYMCGVVLNRGRVVGTAFFLPMLLFLLYTEELLLLTGQHREVSFQAGRMAIAMAPGIWASIQFEAERNFLQALGEFTPAMYVHAAAFLLHVLWCWGFIAGLELSVVGSGIAFSLTHMLSLLALTVYIERFA